LLGERSHTSGSSTGHGGDTCDSSLGRHHAVSANVIKPASLIFMGINVKRHGVVLIHLNIKLLQSVLTKNGEHHVTHILSGHF